MAASVTFNVGRDVSAVAILANGARLDLTNLTEFDIKPNYKMAESHLLNSPPAKKPLPSGHNGRFNIDRRNGQNDQLFTAIEQNWWNSGSADNGTGASGLLTIFITEVGGAQTIEQYSGVSFWMSNKGDIKQDSPIKQTIEFFASQKVA